MPYAASFQRFFTTHLRPILEDPSTRAGREERIIKLLEDYFSSMPTKEDRAQVYWWLGLMHSTLASVAFADRDVLRAREHHALMEEFYVKSLDEDPNQITVRCRLAEYYLQFLGDAERALAILAPVEKDGNFKDNPREMEQFQYVRLLLRGAALLILGRKAEGLAELVEGCRQHLRLYPNQPLSTDFFPLQQLVIRDVTLAPEELSSLVEILRATGTPDEELRRFERSVGGGEGWRQ